MGNINREFTLKYSSTSASPQSGCKYEVYSNNSALETNKYTPKSVDKEGNITLRCTDLAPPFWPVKEDVIRFKRIIPTLDCSSKYSSQC